MLIFAKYFNLKLISDKTGINKDKLYNNFKDQYNQGTLSDEDKRKIIAVLKPASEEMFKKLGENITFNTD